MPAPSLLSLPRQEGKPCTSTTMCYPDTGSMQQDQQDHGRKDFLDRHLVISVSRWLKQKHSEFKTSLSYKRAALDQPRLQSGPLSQKTKQKIQTNRSGGSCNSSIRREKKGLTSIQNILVTE